MRYEDIEATFAGTGLICRGGFEPGADDGVPGIDGQAEATLIVIGNAGSDMWPHFTATTTAAERLNEPNPLNDWTMAVIKPIAAELGAAVHFPFDRPFLPFQRWAMKADTVWQSPIGPLIHPDHGLWHAYRAALVFDLVFPLPDQPAREYPCENCADRVCLNACPVGAYYDGKYDVPACINHIATPKGSDCIDRHCLARRACPIGREVAYDPPHAAFHMSKFLASARKRYLVDLLE